ncbi:Holliday junction branch migration DNA helicase RuvB [Candidatus Uhrbacteria bacterium]|nr:Holliday junction branch migration DNA helicase RuvB [Candidatus Uhrbacteria bacterium]
MITDPVVQKEEQELDTGLRPKLLSDFIGQQQLTSNLRIFIDAALARKEPLDHVLLHGNPGLGKTTLAHIIAHELHENIRVTSGPALSRVGDLAAILTNLGRGDILFIDEIHRLNKIIEEVLYPAMEDFALDLVVGKGPSARSIRLQLEPFTIIGATTRMNLLSSPLRDRFGVSHHLEFYTDEDIEKILTRSSELLHIAIDEDARKSLAARARKTPRIANRLLKRVRDFAEVKYDGRITHAIANEALSALAIDIHGMDATDRLIIKTIVETFNGGPVGLNTLAAALSEDEATIEEIYEPFLLQQGFLHRTPRGRIATERAYQYLGAKQPTLV